MRVCVCVDRTTLHVAVSRNDRDMVETLLQLGADPHAPDKYVPSANVSSHPTALCVCVCVQGGADRD